ncbi:hypothetical protein P280DRAFT_513116 [Massarina eburnea CBS 473.64]|uniref:F-box domain-containing protein n=1 Tax=Massarina eburnea CBS 473.64 TaxID=1395130 RepID=A0A6A6SBQ1_9PLEO|nr:hypothetical protein P280DRAFT_513116 [Massarina eburnea CBS 473.64]
MDSDVFCVLCGGPFALEQHIYNINPDRSQFQWLYQVQLLGTVSALRNLRMTSANESHTNLCENEETFLSETIGWKIGDADFFQLGLAIYQVLTEDEAGDAIFPLHQACIEIACRVIDVHAMEENEALDSACSALYRMLQDHLHAEPHVTGTKHDILGLKSTCDSTARSVLAIDNLGWWSGSYEKYFTDPLHILHLTPTIFSMLQSLPQNCTCPSVIPISTSRFQGLQGLPSELLERITDLLPPHLIMSLRQSSRTLAQKIPLDDRFWRRRLCDGSLLRYVWDIDERQVKQLLRNTTGGRGGGWSNLVRNLQLEVAYITDQHSGGSEDFIVGLWNRRRIWRIIEDAYTQPHWLKYRVPIHPKIENQNTILVFNYGKISAIGCFIVAMVLAAAWDSRAQES